MDRKKTILMAVLINAGLLAVLFISALVTQEEILPGGEMSAALTKVERPLFPDSADLALQNLPSVESPTSPPPLVQLPFPESPKGENVSSSLETEKKETLVHRLPPLIPEEKTAPLIGTAAPLKESPSPYIQVVVKKGDSLDKIAKAHHTTVDEIIKINHLPSSFLKVGQMLQVPKEKGGAIATAPNPKVVVEKSVQGSMEYYTVKVGDNPWTIAMKHHMKVEELLRLNQLNEEKARKLKPGDRLRVR